MIYRLSRRDVFNAPSNISLLNYDARRSNATSMLLIIRCDKVSRTVRSMLRCYAGHYITYTAYPIYRKKCYCDHLYFINVCIYPYIDFVIKSTFWYRYVRAKHVFFGILKSEKQERLFCIFFFWYNCSFVSYVAHW